MLSGKHTCAMGHFFLSSAYSVGGSAPWGRENGNCPIAEGDSLDSSGEGVTPEPCVEFWGGGGNRAGKRMKEPLTLRRATCRCHSLTNSAAWTYHEMGSLTVVKAERCESVKGSNMKAVRDVFQAAVVCACDFSLSWDPCTARSWLLWCYGQHQCIAVNEHRS